MPACIIFNVGQVVLIYSRSEKAEQHSGQCAVERESARTVGFYDFVKR